MRPKCPCQDCFDRHLLCHGRCEKYQTWKAAVDEQNAIKWAEKKKEVMPPRLAKHIGQRAKK